MELLPSHSDLLKKNKFHWSAAITTTIENLKVATISAPMLALPDLSKEFFFCGN